MNYDLLREQLTRHEGRRNHIYVDSVGKLTIGIGHNIDDLGLSDEVVDLIFAEDIQNSITECQNMFPNWHAIPDTKQVVICNMMFNMGYYKLSGFRRFRSAVENGYWNKAADEMKDSKWYRQVKGRGIELEALMRGGSE